MHLKNWSLIYHDKQNASLAPAYDFVSTIFYIPDESFALKFSRMKRFAKFSQNELSHLANKARLPEKLVLDVAMETVAKFHEVWRAEKNNLALIKDMIRVIDKHLTRIPIAAGEDSNEPMSGDKQSCCRALERNCPSNLE